jgi:hypothetical protein
MRLAFVSSPPSRTYPIIQTRQVIVPDLDMARLRFLRLEHFLQQVKQGRGCLRV